MRNWEMLLIGGIRQVVINAAIRLYAQEMNNPPIIRYRNILEHKDDGQSSDNSLLYKD